VPTVIIELQLRTAFATAEANLRGRLVHSGISVAECVDSSAFAGMFSATKYSATQVTVAEAAWRLMRMYTYGMEPTAKAVPDFC
jgi:hypothetical protein